MKSVDMDGKYPVCNKCGTTMTEFDGWAWYTCPNCDNSVRILDGKVIGQDEIFGPESAVNSNRKCQYCGESLSGAPYTEPWEDGNNADGYVKCPHCGKINFF